MGTTRIIAALGAVIVLAGCGSAPNTRIEPDAAARRYEWRASLVTPWHVHHGRCGGNGPIAGDPSAYPLLSVDNDGNARATATLDIALPASGDYYVNVHALATNMNTIISCGNLAPPVL